VILVAQQTFAEMDLEPLHEGQAAMSADVRVPARQRHLTRLRLRKNLLHFIYIKNFLVMKFTTQHVVY
jgi:hypothetical protein